MTRRTRLSLGVTLTSVLIFAGLALAPAAQAAQFTLTWKADATTTVKKLNQVVPFPQTTFTATVTSGTATNPATLVGTLVLPPTKTKLKLGTLDLVTITMEVAEPTQVTGTIAVDGPVWTVDAQQSFRVRITKISPSGSPWINLVRPGCQTSVTTAHLTGTIDFTKAGSPGGPGDYVMAGSYPIPRFSGCGLLVNPVLNSLVAGPGNPLSVHFTH